MVEYETKTWRVKKETWWLLTFINILMHLGGLGIVVGAFLLVSFNIVPGCYTILISSGFVWSMYFLEDIMVAIIPDLFESTEFLTIKTFEVPGTEFENKPKPVRKSAVISSIDLN